MPQKRLTVDRIESDIAVCFDDDDNKVEIKLGSFETVPKEGEVIGIAEDGSILKLPEETAKREARIYSLFDKIKNRSDKK